MCYNSIKENFNIQSIKYLFDSNIFDNKTVFLIANNQNISEKTKIFLDNYNYKDAIVIRFNGFQPIIKNYCKSKTDIMIYRKTSDSFLGINDYYNNINNNKFINVFTNDSDNIENDVKDGIYVKKDILPFFSKIIKDNIIHIMLTQSYNYNDKKYYHMTGFQTFLSLFKKNKMKKIYLVGYTFHNKSINYVHNGQYEYELFHKIKNDKVEILI